MRTSNEKNAVINLDSAIRDLKAMRADLIQAYDFQWERPPGRVDPYDPGIRSRGGHADPTGDAAVNESRLKLRRAVKMAESDAENLAKATWNLATRLRVTLRAYDMERE